MYQLLTFSRGICYHKFNNHWWVNIFLVSTYVCQIKYFSADCHKVFKINTCNGICNQKRTIDVFYNMFYFHTLAHCIFVIFMLIFFFCLTYLYSTYLICQFLSIWSRELRRKIASLPLCSVLAFHDESKMSSYLIKTFFFNNMFA